METPRRIWWARPRKLCLLERPGGGGRTHRAERREAEIEYLVARGVRIVVSTMRTRHGLAEYERAGPEGHHLPVPSTAGGADVLDDLVALLRRELLSAGAVAVHGDLRTDFVAAVGAAHLHDARGVDPADGLRAAAEAGLEVSPEAAALLGLDYEAVGARAA